MDDNKTCELFGVICKDCPFVDQGEVCVLDSD